MFNLLTLKQMGCQFYFNDKMTNLLSPSKSAERLEGLKLFINILCFFESLFISPFVSLHPVSFDNNTSDLYIKLLLQSLFA